MPVAQEAINSRTVMLCNVLLFNDVWVQLVTQRRISVAVANTCVISKGFKVRGVVAIRVLSCAE
jgi:hypothetical protein